MEKRPKAFDVIQERIKRQKEFFATGKTKDLSFRLEQLRKLKRGIKDYESKISEALRKDLNKSEFDAYLTEIGIVYKEINHVLKHLKSWAKPKRVKTAMSHIGSVGHIYHEPYGVALIISPWNYPFQLAISPLIGAIAAGNCAIIKPSELSPHVSEVLAELMIRTFPEEYVSVVEGGVEVSTELLEERFDKIFFTGSVAVGKIVMKAAAEYLTPLTLELGGKSPCIVHEDANLDLAAKRIVWGKFLNAGQTCIAPDYLLVHKKVKDHLIERMKKYIREIYGQDIAKNEEFTVIVNKRHFQRLVSFLDQAHIVVGGHHDSERRFIEPTILDHVDWEHSVMKEEIFGPILPVLEYEELEEALSMVNDHDKPLALYFFSENKGLQERMIEGASYGGGCINDTIMHIATPYLPFGGVGSSGTGAYHGRTSFEVFSHKKSILKQTTRYDLPMRYPSTKNALKIIKFFLR